jgi:uncharacterized membrane protein
MLTKKIGMAIYNLSGKKTVVFLVALTLMMISSMVILMFPLTLTWDDDSYNKLLSMTIVGSLLGASALYLLICATITSNAMKAKKNRLEKEQQTKTEVDPTQPITKTSKLKDDVMAVILNKITVAKTPTAKKIEKTKTKLDKSEQLICSKKLRKYREIVSICTHPDDKDRTAMMVDIFKKQIDKDSASPNFSQFFDYFLNNATTKTKTRFLIVSLLAGYDERTPWFKKMMAYCKSSSDSTLNYLSNGFSLDATKKEDNNGTDKTTK